MPFLNAFNNVLEKYIYQTVGKQPELLYILDSINNFIGGKTITKAFLTVHTYLHIRYASIAKCIQML